MGIIILPAALAGSPLVRLLAAAFLGGVIGLERDIHGRAAGLRTHLLVSLGAALFMLLSSAVAQGAAGFDPGRIAAQIVTGIGFIGAGAILKEGLTIRGLTTAASLWVIAAIGMAAGAGYIEIAFVVMLVALASLVFLNKFEQVIARDSYRILTVRTGIETEATAVIDRVKNTSAVSVLFCEYERDHEKGQMTIRITLRLHHKGVTDKLAHSLVKDIESSDFGILSVRWSRQ